MVLLALQLAIFFTLIALFRRRVKSFTILFSVASWLLVPFMLLIGYFVGGVDANICYSDVVTNIKKASLFVVETSDVEVKRTYIHGLESLTVNGYESQCEDLRGKSLDLSKTLGLQAE